MLGGDKKPALSEKARKVLIGCGGAVFAIMNTVIILVFLNNMLGVRSS